VSFLAARSALTAPGSWARFVRGALLAGVAAVAAQETAIGLHVPAPLVAVILGLGAATLWRSAWLTPGLGLWSKSGLRLGVALMGAQIAWGELLTLGVPALLAGGGIVFGGLVIGSALGVLLGLPLAEAAIAAAAVSICGASAALAVAQVAPQTPDLARRTALVVVGVNLLSTAAMLSYPLLARALALSPSQAGLFFGLSIQDVAQVTGAGATVSAAAAHAATLAKLGRIVWLGPTVMVAGVGLARGATVADTAPRRRIAAPPGFVWGFAALALLRALNLLPSAVISILADASRLLLLGAVFAISARLDARALTTAPLRLVIALCLTTAVVAGLALAAVFGLGT
jgi:uncharacterized membrane protein YadS